MVWIPSVLCCAAGVTGISSQGNGRRDRTLTKVPRRVRNTLGTVHSHRLLNRPVLFLSSSIRQVGMHARAPRKLYDDFTAAIRGSERWLPHNLYISATSANCSPSSRTYSRHTIQATPLQWASLISSHHPMPSARRKCDPAQSCPIDQSARGAGKLATVSTHAWTRTT